MEKTRRPVRSGDVSRAVATRQLKFLMKKYDGICQYCLKKIPAGLQTREHIKRLIDGGTSEMSNLTLACERCNYDANHQAHYIRVVTDGIQDCIQRNIEGLPIVGRGRISHRERVADTWPILIEKAIFGTLRRQQVGAKLVAAPPGGVECSSIVTKKLRK